MVCTVLRSPPVHLSQLKLLSQNVGKHAKIKTQLSPRAEYYQQQSLPTLSTVQHLPRLSPLAATQTLPYCGYVAALPSGI